MMQDNKLNAEDKIAEFIRKNRKSILTVTGVLIILAVCFISYLFVKDYLDKKAISKTEELIDKFEEIRPSLDENASEEISGKAKALLEEITAFTGKNKIPFLQSKFAVSKAWSLAGQIYSQRKDWTNAEEAWRLCAETGAKTYLAPIAFFNAAAAAEERGNIEQAIELLENCLSCSIEFPSYVRAQFSVGRLHEQLGNYQDALAAYRAVLINWPNMPVWQYLARSRIAAIEIR